MIDLYQPARVDPAVPLEETVGAVADLIKEGKVRYLGVSEMNAAQLRRAHAVHPVAALQIEYSLATRVIEPEILPTARELGVAIVAYGALSRGLLTNAFDGELPIGDFRAHSPRFTGANLAHNLDRVAVLREIAAAKGCSAAQLAIAWVLSRGEDILPIIGTTKRSRLPEILGVLDIELGADDLARLEELPVGRDRRGPLPHAADGDGGELNRGGPRRPGPLLPSPVRPPPGEEGVVSLNFFVVEGLVPSWAGASPTEKKAGTSPAPTKNKNPTASPQAPSLPAGGGWEMERGGWGSEGPRPTRRGSSP